MNTRLCAAFLIVVLSVALAPGQTPLGTAFTYQGRLETAAGPVNGPHDLRFRLYDALAVGTQIGATVCVDNVNVVDGLVTQPLDFGAQFTGQQRFLEVEVRADSGRDCTNAAGFFILTPRQPLNATPYALQTRGIYVDDIGRVGIGTTTPFALLNIDGGLILNDVLDEDVAFSTGNFYINNSDNEDPAYHYQSDPEQHEFFVGGGLSMKIAPNGNVGIGTPAPSAPLHVESARPGEASVYGLNTAAGGLGCGGRFESAGDEGIGVYGATTSGAGETYGVYGESSGGHGVFGHASSTTGNKYGGYFKTDSGIGRGVYGFATSTGGGFTYGVYGLSGSTFGRGVFGSASASTGPTIGVQGRTSSMEGSGVSGLASAESGATYGVRGAADSPSGFGVYSTGNLGASGVKSFRIDHPDDPTNKYLLHYAAESPEVINFYSETVMLDERGEAVVQLPPYFAKINTRPRYQLTAVGAAMPMLHVAQEIAEAALNAGAVGEPTEAAPVCSFRIAGGSPSGKVSWEVKAIRNDRWVQKRGAPVELEKQGFEKGTYQHPELYGQPREKGVNFDATRAEAALQAATTPQRLEPDPPSERLGRFEKRFALPGGSS